MGKPVTPKNIKIVSDGTNVGTKVMDAKTGNTIGFVQKLDIHFDVNELPTASAVVVCPELEVEGLNCTIGDLPTVWYVGQWREGKPWEMQGVFSSRSAAIKACRNRNYFICPIAFNFALPDETVPTDQVAGFFYPLAECCTETETKND